jgi:hypothetical protein
MTECNQSGFEFEGVPWEAKFLRNANRLELRGGSLTLAKRKEKADKEESAAPVSGGEASVAGAKPSTKSVKKGKLPPKNKSRLPRRQKKAQLKAAGHL